VRIIHGDEFYSSKALSIVIFRSAGSKHAIYSYLFLFLESFYSLLRAAVDLRVDSCGGGLALLASSVENAAPTMKLVSPSSHSTASSIRAE
jgi:hypothetical protein